MLKTILTGCALAVALLAPAAYAQSDTAGEAKAAHSKSATKQEKADAKAKRKASGKDVAKSGEGRENATSGHATSKKATADEKAAAKSKRKAEGAEVSKKGSAGGEAATTGK